MFMLSSDGRDEDIHQTCYHRYMAYLQENKADFPPSAFTLASSEWYHNFNNHHAPHDGWLERAEFIEVGIGERWENRTLALRIRLLASYHDAYIEFYYPQVFSYKFQAPHVVKGHTDWRYDELRLSENKHLIHEIEWRGGFDTPETRWMIEANDVVYSWLPINTPPLAGGV